ALLYDAGGAGARSRDADPVCARTPAALARYERGRAHRADPLARDAPRPRLADGIAAALRRRATSPRRVAPSLPIPASTDARAHYARPRDAGVDALVNTACPSAGRSRLAPARASAGLPVRASCGGSASRAPGSAAPATADRGPGGTGHPSGSAADGGWR